MESGNGGSDPNYQFHIYTPSLPTTAYSLDRTVSSTLTKEGEYDTYTFKARSGQRLFFDRLAGNNQIAAKLYSPSNVLVASGDLGRDIAPFFLEEDGNYRLVIDGSDRTTGDYSFRLVDLDTAPTLTLDKPTSASLNPGTEADFYQFAGSAGERLYFHLGTATWPSGQADWVLYGPDNQALAAPSWYQPDFSVVLPTAGTYTLGVRGYAATSLDYSFTAYTTPIATTTLTLGSPIAAALAKPGERDEYAFTGTVGQHLFFDALVGNSSMHGRLIGPSGVELLNNTIDKDWSPIVLAESGTYRLAIDGDGATTGNYSFRLSDLAATTALTVGTATNGSLTPGNSVNLYQYAGKAGQTLSFNLSGSAWSGANWVLYDPSGMALATPDANSPNFQVTLPASGLYALAVAGSSPNPVNYSFTVRDNSAAPTTNSGFGALQNLSVNPGQVVDYNFTASAGTIVLYNSRDEQNGSNGWLRVRLQNPDGTYAFADRDERYDLGPTVLTQSGNYKLQVYNADATRTASFEMLQLPKNLGPGTNYLAMESPVAGTLDRAESKVYTFQAVNGLKVLLNGMAGQDVYTLYDSSGRQVFQQDNSSSSSVWSDSGLYTLTQNDLYHLVVKNESGADQNPFSFELLNTTNTPAVSDGVPIAGSLADGRLGFIYRVNAKAGDRLFFDSMATNAPNGNYRWQLYGPADNVVFDQELRSNAEAAITATGEYDLYIQGGPDTSEIDYKFGVFSYTSDAKATVTPGVGGTSSSDPDALGLFSVKLGVKDGRGGSDVQSYQIRLGPDPQNHNPAITSHPETRFALDDDAYRYQVKALDPDGDKLSYRLVNSPQGALIDKDTGELLWFPEANVAAGSQDKFTVEVTDGRGGKDVQSFAVDVYQSLGTIQGAVFDDLNANGLLDSKLISGDNPSIVFAIDVSGSTIAPFYGKGKYKGVKTVLDAEKAAVKATVDAIVAMGGGDRVKLSFIPFTNDGTIQNMDPTSPANLVTSTTALADRDHNGIPDYLQILNSYQPGGNSKFTPVVQKIDQLVGLLSGTPNVIYMSDGYGYLDPTVAKTVANDIKSKGGNLNAFAIGAASTYSTLRELDPNAIQVQDIKELTDIFSGFDDRYAKEPFMNGVTVYLDLNHDGHLDPGDPYQVTQQDNTPNSLDTNTKYYFTFKNLLPGTYTVRTVMPSGYSSTTPTGGVWTDTITATGETDSNLFGLTRGSTPPAHQDPVFVTTPPAVTQIRANEAWRYDAVARDPDASAVSYDLVTAPDGMTVDARDGTVVWSPTTQQVEKYYQDLHAEQARLTALGRGAYAPTVVEFNALLRAKDDKGGQALQYIKVQVMPENHPPVLTSTFPTNAQPQVGKPFQYQATAIDPDKDPISFELVNAPSGVAIDPQTGLLTWTPTASQLGAEPFAIRVKDDKGGANLQTVNPTVVNPTVNHPPVLTSTPRTTARIGGAYFYTLQASDPDNDPLAFTLVSAPTGMKLDKGVMSWTPTANQFGDNSVTVQVSDGQGGSDTQSFAIRVSNQVANLPPVITSTPETVTTLQRTYQYHPTAVAPEGDRLLWSLSAAPQGMVIDPQTGTIVWQPTAAQIGDTTVDLKVSDPYGGDNIQEFTLHVAGTNSPPRIVSIPVTEAGVGQTYVYQAMATDPENDAVSFSLGGKPAGMTIDRDGLIHWTPTADQVGKYEVEVVATDDRGASTDQTYTVQVSATALDHPPVITSTPSFVAAVGSPYKYQVSATDADGHPITYQLLQGPSGMTIDATTGLVTWANPLTGSYGVTVAASDGIEAAAQRFTLSANTIAPPVITSTPLAVGVPQIQYRYDLVAVDPQGGPLTYSLDATSRSQGMTVDNAGRISWTPTTAQVGSHPMTLTVTDAAGLSTQQSFKLAIAADTEAPQVKLMADYSQVNRGDRVTFQARATDNVEVAGVQLLVNGVAVALDAQGMATVTLNQAGTVTATAIATDEAGNKGNASTSVQVLDPNATSAAVVTLDLSAIASGVITAPTAIKGTVSDANLDHYSLEVAPVSGGEFKEVFRGTQAVTNGVLGKFDSTLLSNDTYTLRLSAYDKNGTVSKTEDTLSVAGDLKLGNFKLSFTDLSLPVTGIPITLTRTYDSLDASNSEDFGYGWRLEFRDTDLRTSVGPATGEVAELGEQNPFKDGSRVYITLPGGKREGFTFKPTIDPLSKYLASAGAGVNEDPNLYHPAFVADKGVTDSLTVQDTRIIHGADTDRYYGLAGSSYNPADTYYGGKYTLTTKEGVVYTIDAKTGKLLSVTDTNGNKLTYTDADITSSTGQKITFGRDAQNRITSVTDPMGKQIQYQYDALGDLVGVTDRDGNTTQFVYNSTHSHYLDRVIDPLGRTGVRNQYDDSGRLTQMVDANGKAVNLNYDPSHDVETVKDALGNPTTYEYDERGNVVQEVDALGKITKRTYDDNNNLLSETVISDRSGANGFTNTYTYDNSGNKLTETDPLGKTTYYTYGGKSRLLTETDPLGRTTTNTYDGSGNLLSTKDAAGNITSYGYNQLGLLSSVTNANKQTTKFEYDEYGNVTKITDALGNVTTDTYNLNGNKLTETRQMMTTTGVKSLVETWTYDNLGHIKTLIDAENHTTTYEYDKLGHQTAVIDALNHRTEYQYDNKGQLVETIYLDSTPNNPDDNPRTTIEYDSAGRKVKETDRAGRVTQYKYDAAGRLIATIYPDNTPNNPNDNPTTKTEYYTDGSVKAEIDELGNRTEYRYDADGRQIEIIYPDNTPSTLDDNPTTTYKYDVAGQRIAETDALGHTTSYVYNDLGQLTQTHFTDGTYTTNSYDALGRRTATTDQGGKTTEYSYDALGHLTGVKNALGDWTTYSYDEVGNLVSETDANQHTTRFEYDGVGHRIATVLPMDQRSTSTYDAVGNVSTSTDFNGNTITYHYDEQNRLVEEDFPDSTKTTFTYTLTGQRQTVTDVNGTTSYTYNERDRLLSTTNPDGKSISYTYDAAGNRTSVTTPAGTTSYTFDVRNRLGQVIDPDGSTTSYTYDAVNNLISTVMLNGTVETRKYDQLNRLIYLENQKATGEIISSYTYILDVVGSRKEVQEHTGRLVDYTYDDLYRLTQEKITDSINGNRTFDYTYDKVGNRKTKIDSVNGTTSYTYDDNDRLLNETTLNPEFLTSG